MKTNFELSKKDLDEKGIAYFENIPNDIITFLKTGIKKTKETKANNTLAGHIKEEYVYDNIPPFVSNYIISSIFKNNSIKEYLETIEIFTQNPPLILNRMWCNFMKKYEFNPIHTHSGIFSFIIFLQIPYDLNKEDRVFPSVNNHKLTSRLVFLVDDKYNRNTNLSLDVDKSFENTMLIFPAKTPHLVYPFFTSKNERITVSGNIHFFNGFSDQDKRKKNNIIEKHI